MSDLTDEKKQSNSQVENVEYKFDADNTQLMHIIINAFYSNKEIFLRELISNSSDALNKIRHESLTNKDVLKDDKELHIQITTDEENNTLTIKDSGIGMTCQELITNLGTIAKSGTKNFVQLLSENNKNDMNLIGQFGVGFYSSFLVADKVVVRSKSNDDTEHIWESNANDVFTVTSTSSDEVWRGTEITLHLKDNQLEYLKEDRIKEIIIKHSEFISYPIMFLTTHEEEVEVEPEEEEDNETDEVKIEEVTDEDDEKKTETRIVHKWKKFNESEPIWVKDPKDVTTEELNEFYKGVSKDWENPLSFKRFTVDGGSISFRGILFIPSKSQQNLFHTRKHYNRIKLYVKRVFVNDNCEDILPDYLNFVPGIVDSEDLPLNVSREMLQQSKVYQTIKKNLIKQCITMFENCAEDDEQYGKFWKHFSQNIKLGVYEDDKHQAKLSKLLRYESTETADGEYTSFEKYVENMKENQEDIYFITGENRKVLENSPHMEQLKKRNLEVLFMTDPIDEYTLMKLKEFDGKKLIAITSDNLEFKHTDEEKAEISLNEKKFSDLCSKIKELLGDKVIDVKLSNRVVDTPCCIITDKSGFSPNMERIMKAQALRDENLLRFYKTRKIFELNPNHETIIALNNKTNDKTFKDLVFLLFDTSLIAARFSLENVKEHTNRMYKLVNFGLGIYNETDSEDEEVETTDDKAEEVDEKETVEEVDEKETVEEVDEKETVEEVDEVKEMSQNRLTTIVEEIDDEVKLEDVD